MGGGISYPLYLWHWPALAFARIVDGATPSVTVRLGAVALSVLLAWMTFAWIEKPFPSRPIMQARVQANEGDIGYEAFHAYYAKHFFPCADASVYAKSEKWGDLVRCFQTKRGQPIDLVMIGDSHAEHLLLGLAEALPHLNIAVYPRSELPFTNSSEYTEIFQSLLNDNHIKHVLLTSMWAVAPLTTDERVAFERHLAATVELLTTAGKKVVLTTDTPKFGFDPQRCKFSHPLSGQSSCDESNESYRRVQSTYVPLFVAARKRNANVSLIHFDDLFCDDSMCRMAIDGRIFFRDNNHVNFFGSQLVGSELAKQLLLIEPSFKP